MNVTVLRTYRAQLEQALRAELAELQRALDAAEAERRRLDVSAEEDARRYLEAARAGLPAAEAAGRYELMEGLAEAVLRAQALVSAAHERWRTKMAEVLEAARERKKMESLQRRRAAADRRSVAAAAQRETDEAASRGGEGRGPAER